MYIYFANHCRALATDLGWRGQNQPRTIVCSIKGHDQDKRVRGGGELAMSLTHCQSEGIARLEVVLRVEYVCTSGGIMKIQLGIRAETAKKNDKLVGTGSKNRPRESTGDLAVKYMAQIRDQ